MKYVKYLLVVIVTTLCITTTQAKEKEIPVTDTIQVKGNCGICKKTIESAASIKGVKKAEWNMETHVLYVTYLPSKTTNDKIQQAIAHGGYDTEKFRADDKVYNSLHTCCKYER